MSVLRLTEQQLRIYQNRSRAELMPVSESLAPPESPTLECPINLRLPWPPSVNTYLKRGSSKPVLTDKAKHYKAAVCQLCIGVGSFGSARLEVDIRLYPPNEKIFDIDNYAKVAIDSLEAAGLFDNDSQIDAIRITRRSVIKDGQLVVTIGPI